MISAILLAAGQSKRMNGENKLTKKLLGTHLINHSVKNILNSSIDELIIVLGYQDKIIESIIDKNQKIKFILNKDFENGMSSSIKIGIAQISKKTEAFFICLGDMPFISQNIYDQIIKSKNKNEIIVPTYNGKQGNPVLFSKSTIDKIINIKGDMGAKKIIETNKQKVFYLETNDQAVTKDFNTKESFI